MRFGNAPSGNTISWNHRLMISGNQNELSLSIEEVEKRLYPKEIKLMRKDSLIQTLTDEYYDSPIIKLASDAPWIHTYCTNDFMIKFVWDTRQIVDIVKAPKYLTSDDYVFVTNDSNRVIRGNQSQINQVNRIFAEPKIASSIDFQ